MVTKKSGLAVLLIAIFLINSVYVSAISASIGNARMVLYPEVNGWTTTKIDKTIYTRNVNNQSVNVTLMIDSDSDPILEIIDESFILQPGEEKDAKFVV